MKPYLKILSALVVTSLMYTSCSENHSPQFMKNESVPNPAPAEAAAPMDSAMNSESRNVIKTADIILEVDKVETAVQSYQQLVNSLHGHVFHLELKNEKYRQQEIQHSLDSNVVVSEIHPSGMMKIRVPVQHGDSFISAILKMDGQIESFMFDENDVTEDLTEKKELMMSDAGMTGQKQSARNIAESDFAKESRESFIRRKKEFLKMNYQTNNLWFDVRLNGKTYSNTHRVARAETIRVPFYVRATRSFQNGWYGLSAFVTALLNLWPLFLLAGIALLFIKKYWPPVTKKHRGQTA